MTSEISAIRHEELFLLRHVDTKKIVQLLATRTCLLDEQLRTERFARFFLWLTGIRFGFRERLRNATT